MDWEITAKGLKRKLALAILIVIVLGGLIQMLGKRLGYFGDFAGQTPVVIEEQTKNKQEQVETKVPSAAVKTEKQLAVHIVGAVKKPGVYYVAEGTRLHQLVDKAVATKDAALSYVNLAQPLQDGLQVVIPNQKEVNSLLASQVVAQPAALTRGGGTASAGGKVAGAPGSAASGLVNLNTATAEQLETLPGIGPAYSQRILDYRQANGPFKSVQELQKVSGIGVKRLAQLEDKVTVR